MSSQHRLREKQKVYTLLSKLLSAMKALSYAELQNLQSQKQGQKQVLTVYRRVISTLLRQGAVVPVSELPPLLISIGTERGFCGDINRRVYSRLQTALSDVKDAGLILLGERLFKFHNQQSTVACLNGAVVAEDVEPLVTGLMGVILENAQQYSFINTQVIFLDNTNNEVVLFPMVEWTGHPSGTGTQAKGQAKGYGPLLYEEPARILEKLLPEYFFATLQFCLKSALLSENLQRYRHMQEATRHLDDKHQQLSIKMNQVRREKIIEEILVSLYNEEVILF